MNKFIIRSDGWIYRQAATVEIWKGGKWQCSGYRSFDDLFFNYFTRHFSFRTAYEPMISAGDSNSTK